MIVFDIGRPIWSARGGEIATVEAHYREDDDRRYLLTRERINIASGSERARFARYAAELANAMLAPSDLGSSGNAEARATAARGAQDSRARAALLAFEENCLARLESEDRAAELVTFASLPPVGPAETYDVFGLRLPLDAPSLFFGSPGSLKSTVASRVAVDLARNGVKVLVLDLEASPDASKRVIDAASAGVGLSEAPATLYRTRSRELSLTRRIDTLTAECRQHGIEFVVIDSATVAASGELNDSAVAKSYFDALRALGVAGSITVAHQAKAATDIPAAKRTPLGSQVWTALPRCVVAFDRFDGPTLATASGVRYVQLTVTASNTETGEGERAYVSAVFGTTALRVTATTRRPVDGRQRSEQDRDRADDAALSAAAEFIRDAGGEVSTTDLRGHLRVRAERQGRLLDRLAERPDIVRERRGPGIYWRAA